MLQNIYFFFIHHISLDYDDNLFLTQSIKMFDLKSIFNRANTKINLIWTRRCSQPLTRYCGTINYLHFKRTTLPVDRAYYGGRQVQGYLWRATGVKPRFGTPRRSRTGNQIKDFTRTEYYTSLRSVTVYYILFRRGTSNNAGYCTAVFFYSKATAISKTFSVSEHRGGFLYRK